MAYELRVNYAGALNVYAVLRRLSDMKVWNGATWETWANGNIANYDIPLTSQGGDVYAVNFPSAIDGGLSYRVTYYSRTGAAPAITDLALRTDEGYWDGATVAAAAPAAGGITAGQVVDAIRRRLNDLGPADPRFPESELIKQVKNGQRAILQREPQALITSAGALDSIADPTTKASTLNLDQNYEALLVDYATWRLLGEDNPDTAQRQMSRDAMESFFTELGVKV